MTSAPATVDHWLGGKWSSHSDTRTTSWDPATGDLVGDVPVGEDADVDAAVRSARRALEGTDWSTNPSRRATALSTLADALAEATDELAELLSRENGKTLAEGRAEVAGSVDALRFNAGVVRAFYGRYMGLAPGVDGIVAYEPVGVVAFIVPWNWPLLLLVRDLAPALAAGTTAVIKPPSLTPVVVGRLMQVFARTDALPPGVLNLVFGSGSTVGQRLVEHPGVDAVAFTGETENGKAIMRAAAGTMKRLLLELGGKSSITIFSDADLEEALPTAVGAMFVTCGQMCMAVTRVLVEASIADEVADDLCKRIAALRVGNGLDPATDVGPLISPIELAKVAGFAEEALRTGRILVGGHPTDEPAGHFFQPTLVTDLPADSPVIVEEVFGPVVTLERFTDEDEALRLANRTRYGLTAGVWTRDLDRALRVAHHTHAGTVWVNSYNRSYAEMESGGYKQSGSGRTRGIGGLVQFSETKHINVTFRQRP